MQFCNSFYNNNRKVTKVLLATFIALTQITFIFALLTVAIHRVNNDLTLVSVFFGDDR